MISAVVFDMDDTLYEEFEYCKSGFRAVAKAMTESADSAGHEPRHSNRSWASNELYNALWSQFVAGNRTTTFNTALKQLGIAYDDELIANMVSTYRRHYPSISLPSDSKTALKALHSRYTLALLTDGYLPAQRLKVQALGIEKYFQCIVYTEELGREYWKPSPIGFEKILEALKLDGKDCVYVADNPAKDFIAANNLNFKTVQVIYPNRIHRDKAPDESAEPKYVIKSLSELPALLEKIWAIE